MLVLFLIYLPIIINIYLLHLNYKLCINISNSQGTEDGSFKGSKFFSVLFKKKIIMLIFFVFLVLFFIFILYSNILLYDINFINKIIRYILSFMLLLLNLILNKINHNIIKWYPFLKLLLSIIFIVLLAEIISNIDNILIYPSLAWFIVVFLSMLLSRQELFMDIYSNTEYDVIKNKMKYLIYTMADDGSDSSSEDGYSSGEERRNEWVDTRITPEMYNRVYEASGYKERFKDLSDPEVRKDWKWEKKLVGEGMKEARIEEREFQLQFKDYIRHFERRHFLHATNYNYYFRPAYERDLEEYNRMKDRVKRALTIERETRARQIILDQIKEKGGSR